MMRFFERPTTLCYPLDGFVGYFPREFSRKPPEVHYVTQMVEHLRPGFVCFDVGAYLGYYTLLFAKFAKVVHAFEPLPANLRRLRKNVRLNGLGNAHVHELAVGNVDGTLQIRAGQGPDPMASALRHETATCLEVRQTRLDSFCARESVYPDLLKIDVEGYELQVFEGMQELLEKKRPVLFLEIHSSYLSDEQVDTMFRALTRRGYRIFSWLEDVEPGGYGFWRNMAQVQTAAELKVGATLALP